MKKLTLLSSSRTLYFSGLFQIPDTFRHFRILATIGDTQVILNLCIECRVYFVANENSFLYLSNCKLKMTLKLASSTAFKPKRENKFPFFFFFITKKRIADDVQKLYGSSTAASFVMSHVSCD